MRGLKNIPDTAELRLAYDAFQSRSPISPENLVLYAQWSRFDPRLGEQCARWITENWETIPLQELRARNLVSTWPQALALLSEFSLLLIKEKYPQKVPLFKKWQAFLVYGIEPAHHEQFYIGLAKIAGKTMLKDALYSTQPYRKWGYLARETLIQKVGVGKSTQLTAPQRKLRLNELLRSMSRITVNDYILALEGQVSRRQAERDLASNPRLFAQSETRGRYYRKKR